MHSTSDAAMVLVFSMYPKTLVYHDYGGRGGRVDGKAPEGWCRYERRTVCGRLSHWQEWVEVRGEAPSQARESNISTTFLRLDHARMIGRPCSVCWPEHEVLTGRAERA